MVCAGAAGETQADISEGLTLQFPTHKGKKRNDRKVFEGVKLIDWVACRSRRPQEGR